MECFTADLHLFHRSVIAFCQRPFSDLDAMHEAFIARWNGRVGQDDTVYILGDLSFGNKVQTEGVVKQLAGKKILGVGNHDKGRTVTWWKAVGIDEVRSELFYVDGFRCSHFPEVETMMRYDPDRESLLHYGAPSDGTPLLHGHVHTLWKSMGNQLNVGVDVSGYEPLSLEQIKKFFQPSHLPSHLACSKNRHESH